MPGWDCWLMLKDCCDDCDAEGIFASLVVEQGQTRQIPRTLDLFTAFPCNWRKLSE